MSITLPQNVSLLPPDLQTGVREYAELHSDLQRSGVALGSCYVVSREFLEFLGRRGILSPADLCTVRPVKLSAPDYPIPFEHHVAQVGDWCVDWTVRQYCWNAEWPLMWKP